jgi:flagellar protein FliO/FliZ
MEWMLIKTLGSLVAVLALMGGLAFVVRRYGFRPGVRRREGIEIEILGSRSLGPRRSVQVLRVMNRIIVVGVSDHGMQTLSEMTDEVGLSVEDRPRGPLAAGMREGARADFPSSLRAALGLAPRRPRARETETLL